jgi:hypothetical protein
MEILQWNPFVQLIHANKSQKGKSIIKPLQK